MTKQDSEATLSEEELSSYDHEDKNHHHMNNTYNEDSELENQQEQHDIVENNQEGKNDAINEERIEERIEKEEDFDPSRGATLYVNGLSRYTKEADLFSVFGQHGTVVRINLVMDPHTKENRGFAFIEMSSIPEADNAIEALHNKDLNGRRIGIEKAKRDKPRSPTPGRYFGPKSALRNAPFDRRRRLMGTGNGRLERNSNSGIDRYYGNSNRMSNNIRDRYEPPLSSSPHSMMNMRRGMNGGGGNFYAGRPGFDRFGGNLPPNVAPMIPYPGSERYYQDYSGRYGGNGNIGNPGYDIPHHNLPHSVGNIPPSGVRYDARYDYNPTGIPRAPMSYSSAPNAYDRYTPGTSSLASSYYPPPSADMSAYSSAPTTSMASHPSSMNNNGGMGGGGNGSNNAFGMSNRYSSSIQNTGRTRSPPRY